MKTEVFYCKNDMYVRLMRFSILSTSADSSDKTQMMFSTILLCLFVSKFETVADTENFHGGFQWHMVVICIWCALFVTSPFDIIFMFPKQRFGEVF